MFRKITVCLLSVAVLLGGAHLALAAAYTDPFDGPKLAAMWTFRTPDKNDEYRFEKGWLVFDIQASQDLYVQGTDFAPMLLMDPPADDEKFSIETKVNVVMENLVQPPASQAGLIIFREDTWAYSLWGPYNNQDIRLEDCVGASYRWRDQAQIAVDNKIDSDVWVKIEKRGEELEFFYKDNEDDPWESGGIDKKLGPQYNQGTYQIGLFLKNWGGSVAMTTAFDYFHSPEIAGLAVEPTGKAAVTWGRLKSR
jgi:hypothetical protein